MARSTGIAGRRGGTPARYERHLLSPGLVCWVYEYENLELRTHAGLASGLEIGVQLDGLWVHRGSNRGEGRIDPGMIHRTDPGERFGYRYRAAEARRPGRQVGFIVYPERCAAFAGLSGELRMPATAGERDDRLLELARFLAHGAVDASVRESASSELLSYVERHAQLVPEDPLQIAKKEIDRAPELELYVKHLAEIAGMAPESFTRRFKRRYGTTPIAYRLETRLNRAAHLGWSRPDLGFAEIAAMCGFRDESFFHRSFRRFFGTTPARHARRS